MMRRSIAWGALLLSFSLASVASARDTRLCHVSPGAPPQTLDVAKPADVQMHLGHGDVLGPCNDAAVCNAACDDHNACTVNDGLVAKGACTCGPRAVTCAQDSNPCTAEVCNPTRGTCDSVPANEGRPCYDASACTQHNGTCQAGTCTGGAPVVCPTIDRCHQPGQCDPSTGACVNLPMPDGTTCEDGNSCTANDACMTGSCVPGAAYGCDDGDVCTADACDGTGGCSHTPIDRCGVCFPDDCATCQAGCTCADICWRSLMACLDHCTLTYCAAFCVQSYGQCGGAACPDLEATCRSDCGSQNGCQDDCTAP
jgi:Dictyostelium (slime mold) repeat